MEPWQGEFWTQVLTDPGLRIWIRVCQWGFIAVWVWLFLLLVRGGYADITDITRCRYATAREKWDAHVTGVMRTVGYVIASGVGGASTAFGLFVQGAVLFLIWREISAAF